MTSQTCRWIVVVTGHATVLVIHIVLVVFVTIEAGERGEIPRLIVASRAILLPFVLVFTREDREVIRIVVEVRPGPFSTGVT